MKRLACLLCLTSPAEAESLVAARTLPAQTVISAQDLVLVDADIPGALGAADLALGLETRVAIYAGRPVRAEDLGRPAAIERNQIVTLVYLTKALAITTEGRALDRASAGETVRVMNLSSRATVSGVVGLDGTVIISPAS